MAGLIEEIRQKITGDQVEALRASNQQLDRFALELDKLTAMVESDLRQQRRRRLEKKIQN
jgi:hypothetical protein